MTKLKRLVRYLVHHPRVIWKFDFQQPCDVLTAYVDTDFAGCHKTRRSTNGGAFMRGNHLLYCYSTTQATVALSSGEAELGGICKGASKGLGLQSVAADLGLQFSLDVQTDATAAIGICRRRGLGKIRHLAVADLWIQDRLKSNDFTLTKVLGTINPADALTKYIDRSSLERHMRTMNLVTAEGRPEIAPSLTHAIFSQRLLPHRK